MSTKKVYPFLIATLIHAGIANAITIVEDFSTDPAARGWTGIGNTTAPNSYGWSSGTNNAGGAIGEVGGTIQARVGTDNFFGYWDSTLDGTLDQTGSLTATGLFSISSINGFDGGVDFGYLNVTSPASVGISGFHAGGNSQMIGFRFNDGPSGQYRLNAQQSFSNSLRAESSMMVLDIGTDYLFTLSYDPNGGGAGLGVTTLTVNLASDNSLVGSVSTTALNSTGAAIALDAFGFNGLRFADNTTTADIFIDNLEYTAAPEPSGGLLVLGALVGFAARRRIVK